VFGSVKAFSWATVSIVSPLGHVRLEGPIKRYPAPEKILAKATVIPKGVSKRIELATTSFAVEDGRLSAGKTDSRPAIPAVMFFR
jgi:hypothetical protein